MTKKHFKVIAEIIRLAHFEKPMDKSMFIKNISIICEQLNPRFDYQKFYDACMGE